MSDRRGKRAPYRKTAEEIREGGAEPYWPDVLRTLAEYVPEGGSRFLFLTPAQHLGFVYDTDGHAFPGGLEASDRGTARGVHVIELRHPR